ncbi:MAG: hypothetical protein OXH61_05085, partial [Acidimicrobiaceae bacterium]|nr:hypothetical protein [Acidimicrobiaceae bacterium]
TPRLPQPPPHPTPTGGSRLRARTIADLARVISERQVSLGIRRTLWVQARRLEHLAQGRLNSLEGNADEDT